MTSDQKKDREKDLEIGAVELPVSVSEFTNWLTDYHSEVLGEKIQSWVFSHNRMPGPEGPTYNWTIGDLVVSAKKKDMLQVTFWYQPPSGSSEVIPPDYKKIVAEMIDDAVEYFTSEVRGYVLNDLDGFEDHEKALILIKYFSGPTRADWKSERKVLWEINKVTDAGGFTTDWIRRQRSDRGWVMKKLPK